MPLTFHDVARDDYERLRFDILRFVEGPGGSPHFVIYDDGIANADALRAHNPTIGISFNLRVDPVITAVLIGRMMDRGQINSPHLRPLRLRA